MWVLFALASCTAPPVPTDGLETARPTDGTLCAGDLCDADHDGSMSMAFGGTDCDDTDPEVHIAAVEICNTVDDDCDGFVDDTDPDLDLRTAHHVWPDADGDGYGGGAAIAVCVTPPSYLDDATDCDDTNAAVFPDAPEICNGFDDDCDGDVDDTDASLDPAAAPTFHVDVDGDGYGDPDAPLVACDAPGAVLDSTDCAPFDPLVHALVEWWEDADGDGAGDPDAVVLACYAPPGTVGNDDDCNDTDPAQNPRAVWYRDADLDGFGDPAFWVVQCLHPVDYVTDATDCDDLDARENPGALWFADHDGDGFGDPLVPASACGAVRVADDATDCDDLRADVSPGDLEVCDHVDNNCDESIDEGLEVFTWYADEDLDGFAGDVVAEESDCGGGIGSQLTSEDCDDSDPTTHPGAVEECDDLIDHDCDDTPRDRTFGVPSAIGYSVEPMSGHLVDLDGDGDQDVVWSDGAIESIVWNQNLGGGVFGGANIVSDGLAGVGATRTADLDGDGDQDVFATFQTDDTVAWFENQGGAFTPAKVLSDTLDFPFGITSADLDLDGDPEVIATSTGDDRIVWFDNQGAGVFGVQNDLSATLPYRVRAGDLDGDGDPDLVSIDGTVIRWFDNLGNGSFAPEASIVNGLDRAYTLELVDLDGDGDTDVVTGEIGTRDVSWAENLGGAAFAEPVPIMTVDGLFLSHRSADLDGDGDLDVIGCSLGDAVLWSENLGAGLFDASRELTTAVGVGWVDVGDIDGLAPVDVLYGAWREDEVGWVSGETCEL